MIRAIERQIKFDRKRSKTIESLLDPDYDYEGVVFTTQLVEELISALEHEFGQDKCTYSDISWYIFDKKFGKDEDLQVYDKEGKIIPSSTPEELYDLLTIHSFKS